MDLFFADPSEVPLPPNEVRIRELRADVWPDGQRVHVYFEVDPFQKRPNADLKIINARDEEVASVSIIEPMTRKMEFTMHLRGEKQNGEYRLAAILFYTQDEENESGEPPRQIHTVVDRSETKFLVSE